MSPPVSAWTRAVSRAPEANRFPPGLGAALRYVPAILPCAVWGRSSEHNRWSLAWSVNEYCDVIPVLMCAHKSSAQWTQRCPLDICLELGILWLCSYLEVEKSVSSTHLSLFLTVPVLRSFVVWGFPELQLQSTGGLAGCDAGWVVLAVRWVTCDGSDVWGLRAALGV